MPFVAIGVLLVLLKFLEIGPVAAWSWWIVLAPFAVAVVWWAISDATGITARRESDKVDARARARREKNLEAMGMSTKNRKR